MHDSENERLPAVSDAPRPGRGKRWLVGIAVVLVAAFALMRLTLQSRTRDYLESIRHQGLPATLEELNDSYAVVPFKENAALKFLEAGEAEVSPLPAVKPQLPYSGQKDPELPPAGEPLPPEMHSALSRHLADNQEALDLAHAAARLPRSRYPMDLRLGAKTLLPHLARIKALSQLLRLDTVFQSSEHKPEAAARSTLTGFAIAHSLREEPVMISQLVRIACVSITLSGLERMLSENALPEEQLRALLEKVAEAEADNEAGPPKAFSGERSMGIAAFHMTPVELDAVFSMPGGSTGTAAVLLFQLATFTGLRDYDLHFYLKTIEEFVKTSALPFPERLDRAEETMNVALGKLAGNPFRIFSRMLLPSMSKFYAKQAALAAQLRSARLALEIERCRLARNGALPESLAELVPGCLREIPTDPFDGKPLRLERLPKGYGIYGDAAANQQQERQSANKKGKKIPGAFLVER